MRGFNCGCTYTFHFILTLLYKFEKSGRMYLILGPKLVSAFILNRCQLSALNFCLSDNLHQHRWSSYAGNLLPIAYHPEICQANGYWGEFLKNNSCLNLTSGSSRRKKDQKVSKYQNLSSNFYHIVLAKRGRGEIFWSVDYHHH